MSHEIRALSQNDRPQQKEGRMFLMALNCLEAGKANSSPAEAALGHQASLCEAPLGKGRKWKLTGNHFPTIYSFYRLAYHAPLTPKARGNQWLS